MAAKKKDLTVEERIRKETKRLLKLFDGIDKKKLAILKVDIENLAFFTVMTDDLKKKIIENGVGARYQNGENQWGEKTSTDAGLIDKWALRIDNLVGRLINEVPPEQRESRLEAMMRE